MSLETIVDGTVELAQAHPVLTTVGGVILLIGAARFGLRKLNIID